jgi:hypothetical protein
VPEPGASAKNKATISFVALLVFKEIWFFSLPLLAKEGWGYGKNGGWFSCTTILSLSQRER